MFLLFLIFCFFNVFEQKHQNGGLGNVEGLVFLNKQRVKEQVVGRRAQVGEA